MYGPGRPWVEGTDSLAPKAWQVLTAAELAAVAPQNERALGRPAAPSAGAVRRHYLAVLTVDGGDDAGHRLACQQAAGHPQRVIDGLFGFE
jgi:hypothetical protein